MAGKQVGIYRVSMVKESELPHVEPVTPDSIRELLHPVMAGLDREHLYAVLFNGRGDIIGINQVSVGVADATLAGPREIFKGAILLGAKEIALAHNHPSNHTDPSPADAQLTARCAFIGQLLEIELLDHIVVNTDCTKCTSIRQSEPAAFDPPPELLKALGG